MKGFPLHVPDAPEPVQFAEGVDLATATKLATLPNGVTCSGAVFSWLFWLERERGVGFVIDDDDQFNATGIEALTALEWATVRSLSYEAFVLTEWFVSAVRQ
jgi:hypothetical protein